jgi:hypothetical protein
MALFTDGPPAAIADLRRVDSSIEDVASAAGIDLNAKLELAAEEMGQEIFSFLLFLCPENGSTASLQLGATPAVAARQRIGLTDVIASGAVRRWHALRTLAAVYRDLMGTDVNDRYKSKWQTYENLAKQASEYACSTGIGICRNPVQQAPVAVVTETSQATTRLDCRVYVTWVNSAGDEGAPGPAWTAQLGMGDRIVAPLPAPAGVAGWNVYLGIDQAEAKRQNQSLLELDGAWTIPPAIAVDGPAMGDGQRADVLVVERRIIPRG